MEMLTDAGIEKKENISLIQSEAQELLCIFSATKKSIKQKLNKT
jgi:hypothetical protein